MRSVSARPTALTPHSAFAFRHFLKRPVYSADSLNTADMNIESITKFLTQHIADLQAIYQFGSHVRGNARPGSDIDLAVLARDPISAERLFQITQDLAIQLNRDVDLLDLRATSTVMRAQVISTGQCLESKDEPARAEFEMYAYSDYARLNEERRDILKDIKERGLIYG